MHVSHASFLCLFPCPHPFHLNLQINVSAWKSPHHHPPKSASHLHVSGKRPGSSNLRTLSTPNRHHGIRNPIFFWELPTRNFVKLLSCLSFFIFYFDFFMSSLSRALMPRIKQRHSISEASNSTGVLRKGFNSRRTSATIQIITPKRTSRPHR